MNNTSMALYNALLADGQCTRSTIIGNAVSKLDSYRYRQSSFKSFIRVCDRTDISGKIIVKEPWQPFAIYCNNGRCLRLPMAALFSIFGIISEVQFYYMTIHGDCNIFVRKVIEKNQK
jgi:hypothetical protein